MNFVHTVARVRLCGAPRIALSISALVVAVAMLAFPAGASALTWSGSLAVTSFSVTPVPATPGAYATVTTQFELDGDKNNLADLATVTWPTGMLINDGAADTCALSDFNAPTPNCPPDSLVGQASALSYHVSALHPSTTWSGSGSGNVYELPGSPLQLGFALTDGSRWVRLIDTVTVNPGPTLVHVLTESGASSLPIPFTTGSPPSKVLRELSFTLNAETPGGAWFVRNPTTCPGPWSSTLSVVPNTSDPTATYPASFDPGPCAPLDPLSVVITSPADGSSTTNSTINVAYTINGTTTIPAGTTCTVANTTNGFSNFSTSSTTNSLALTMGANTITVACTDSDESGSASVTVTRNH